MNLVLQYNGIGTVNADHGALATPDPNVEGFVTVARDYCALLEAADHSSPDDFLTGLLLVLPQLYLAALALPETEPTSDSAEEDPAMPARLRAITAAIGRTVGPRDSYWEVFDPYEEGGLGGASLSDDLSGIYSDLLDGFMNLERRGPAALPDAVWDWKFSFSTHWGDHLTDALRALHRIRFWRGFGHPSHPESQLGA